MLAANGAEKCRASVSLSHSVPCAFASNDSANRVSASA